MTELHADPFIYFYKNVFASEEIFPEIYHHYSKQKDAGPKFNLRELGTSNDYYVMQKRTGAGAETWVVEVELEVHSLKEKPSYIKGITPRTLVFDTYNTFLPKKIISIRPVESWEPRRMAST